MTATARVYSHLTSNDVAEAVRGLRDEEPEGEERDAQEVAEQLLAALPPAVRAALAARVGK